MEKVLEIKNLCKSFMPFSIMKRPPEGNKGKKVVHAVRDVSFSISRGEIFGIIGSNGAGKSTTVKMIAGLTRPTSGEIFVCGVDALRSHVEAAKHIGALIEAPDLYPRMSGKENLSYLASLDGGVSESRIDTVLRRLSMTGRQDDKVNQYSLGMKQRIGIAQALLKKPDLLILDEPTNGLDPDGIVDIRTLLRSLADKYGIGILISSHILSEMEKLCDTVAVMNAGSLVAVKDAASIGDSKRGLEVRIEIDNAVLVGQILNKEKYDFRIQEQAVYVRVSESEIPLVTRVLVMGGVNISSVKVHKQTLEQTFSDLIHGNVQGSGRENQ